MREKKRKRLASIDAMAVATRFVNAANQHDADALISCVHRDFQSIQPAHPVRNFRGVGQLRSNWEAIFRTEPGFRLTVLRSTVADGGTVWMELHGAGDDAEAAGTFILGVEDGRIRWIRVYSDLVEAVPEPEPETPPEPVADEPAEPVADEPAVAAEAELADLEAVPVETAEVTTVDEREAVVLEAEAAIDAAKTETPADSGEDADADGGDDGDDPTDSDKPRRRRRLLRGRSKS